jgi:hypothetical protein
MTGRIMHGIVSDVSPTRVVLVSLTGNRVAVPLGRLRTNWNFVQPVARRTLPTCERIGCTSAGMVEYVRGQHREFACPRHAPTNIQCQITASYQVPAEPRAPRPGFECRSTPCPTCGDRDPAEDVRLQAFPARLWLCPACSGRWVTLPRVSDEEQSVEPIAMTVAHELGRLQLEADSLIILQSPSWAELRRSPTIEQQLDVNEAIPRVRLRNGLQAFLDTTTMTEQTREQFYGIVRVRSNAVRQAERPVQRLGGSPNRIGVVGSRTNPVRPAPTEQNLTQMVYRAIGEATAADQAATLRRLREEPELRESNPEVPVADIPIEKESIWIQRASGDLVVVIDLFKATDGSDVVSFKRSSAEEVEPAVTMSRRDFLIYHRPHKPSTAEQSKPLVEVSVDEEWECQDGSAMIVTEVDARKEIVFGDDTKTRKHRQIPFGQFALGRWRKIIRRSVYERLRKPEISLTPDDKD